MKRTILFVLLIASFLPVVSPWGTIAYYHLNRDYIARVLCQNRDKPQLHCDGQCYLAKKLKAQQDRQDKETTEQVQNLPSLHLFCQARVLFQFAPRWTVLCHTTGFVYQLPLYGAPVVALLRPPRV